MRHHPWHRASCLRAVLVLAVLVGVGSTRLASADPVDDLRRVLPMRKADRDHLTPLVRSHREAVLKKRVEGLKTIADLRRGLLLAEWATQSDDPKVQDSDRAIRRQIADRLKKALEMVADKGENNARLAAANEITEIGPAVRISPDAVWGYTRELTGIVVKLAADPDLAVRQEALRALGNINAPPEDVVPVFRQVLEKDDLGPRRLAADGLAQLVRVANHLLRIIKTEPTKKAADVLPHLVHLQKMTEAVIPAAAVALQDSDSEVRTLGLEAIQTSALALADLVESPFAGDAFPPEGRKLSEDEVAEVNKANREVRDEIKELEPNLKALHSQAAQIVKLLQDQDPHVRLPAVKTLESIGEVRQRLRKRVASVPLFIGAKGAQMANSAAEALRIDVLEPLLQKLDDVTRLLSEPDVRIRRAAVDLLDVLEESAAPAIPALAQVLCDPNRNVRHAAVRALGHIAPENSADVVSRVAALVADADRDISLAAIATLEAIGPPAKAALPMLIEAIQRGGPDVQVAAIHVLPRIGLEAAAAAGAIPTLIDALKPLCDPRVRRAAAEVLGRFGAAARPAIPALRNLLGDDDADVRIRASDAILNITVGPVD